MKKKHLFRVQQKSSTNRIFPFYLFNYSKSWNPTVWRKKSIFQTRLAEHLSSNKLESGSFRLRPVRSLLESSFFHLRALTNWLKKRDLKRLTNPTGWLAKTIQGKAQTISIVYSLSHFPSIVSASNRLRSSVSYIETRRFGFVFIMERRDFCVDK